MALNNLAALKASVLAWIERVGDPAAETIIADCVTLCEARINRNPNLRLANMETDAVLTLTNGAAQLPFDFLAMKRVVADTASARVLTYVEPNWYREAYPHAGTDESAAFYTISGSVLGDVTSGDARRTQTLRSRSSAALSIIYYAKVPPLATTDPNWLLAAAPDVYLYGTILELLNALEGDATEKYAGMFGAAVQGLIASETFSRGGVLTMRAHMPAP